jgi:hypothetical protein
MEMVVVNVWICFAYTITNVVFNFEANLDMEMDISVSE